MTVEGSYTWSGFWGPLGHLLAPLQPNWVSILHTDTPRPPNCFMTHFQKGSKSRKKDYGQYEQTTRDALHNNGFGVTKLSKVLSRNIHSYRYCIYMGSTGQACLSTEGVGPPPSLITAAMESSQGERRSPKHKARRGCIRTEESWDPSATERRTTDQQGSRGQQTLALTFCIHHPTSFGLYGHLQGHTESVFYSKHYEQYDLWKLHWNTSWKAALSLFLGHYGNCMHSCGPGDTGPGGGMTFPNETQKVTAVPTQPEGRNTPLRGCPWSCSP